MSDENRMLRNIEKLGDRYCEKILLKQWKKARLESDWWEGLKFFFGHSFFRGRRDKLSNEYYYFTIDALEKYFGISPESRDVSYARVQESGKLFESETILKLKNRLRQSGGKGSFMKNLKFSEEMISNNNLIKRLTTLERVEVVWEDKLYRKERKLDNEEDIMMVLDTLKFISDERKGNIYKYLKEAIQSNGARDVYNELTEIRAIADKIASLIIRDIALLNPGIISSQEYEYIFPVDVWVREVSKRLQFGSSDMKDEDIKQTFIKRCIVSGISPSKVAAGLWYLGFNSLDLALEYLDEFEINGQRKSP